MRNSVIGLGSVSGWVGVRGRRVGCEGDSTVRDGASLVPSIPSWPRGRAVWASVGLAWAVTGVK